MSNTFAQLKKNSKSNFDKLADELNKASGKVEFKDDDRFWYPAVDKAGNGYAVIRFLPAPEGEDVPFVRVFSHAFQGPTGSWYIENSLTTLGRQDPVSEYNSKLWNSGLETDKEKARKQKRKLTFISNIYVVSDTANPENNGQVKLFKYGKKIFDKVFEASNPKFPDEEPIDPFNLWTGANLKVKIRNVEGYRNYDASSFDSSGPLLNDDRDLEAIWKKEYSLQEFIAEDQFKSYDELKIKLNRVLGLNNDVSNQIAADDNKSDDQSVSGKSSKGVLSNTKVKEVEPEIEGDELDDLDFFSELADSPDEELVA